MTGFLVGFTRDDEYAAVVGVVDRRLRERRVVEGAERFLHYVDVVVGGVDDRGGEVVDVGDERVTDAQRQNPAVGALADRAGGRLGGGVLRLAGAVPVVDVVGGVVVVLVEVPAGDVVGVAVAVVVDAVGEGADEVLGGEVAAGGRPRYGARDARVAVVVADRDHAVVVGVVRRVRV